MHLLYELLQSLFVLMVLASVRLELGQQQFQEGVVLCVEKEKIKINLVFCFNYFALTFLWVSVMNRWYMSFLKSWPSNRECLRNSTY